MKNIYCTHTYSERLLENIVSQFLPAYDLWSIRPAENKAMEFSSGSCREVDRFKNFIVDHSNKDQPPELLIIFASSEKSYPTIMLSSSKKYLKMRFDYYPDDYMGEPGFIPGISRLYY